MSQPKSSPRCKVWNCLDEGVWLPVLTLLPEDAPPGSTPDVVELQLIFCDRHRHSVRVRDILDDESWERISQFFQGQGRIMPKREAIGLDFRHTEMGYPC